MKMMNGRKRRKRRKRIRKKKDNENEGGEEKLHMRKTEMEKKK